jgi:hypothetical protein
MKKGRVCGEFRQGAVTNAKVMDRVTRHMAIKTGGYLLSSASVGLLGLAAFPGAENAGLLPALFAGMATSLAGMVLRWISYRQEERSKVATPSPASDR